MSRSHGMRALMTRMHSQRLTKRDQRALGRIQHALTAQPLEHLHALTVGHMSRLELLWQGYQAFAIANPDQPLPAQALGIANAWRRTAELLVQIEQLLAERGDSTPNLEDYLQQRAASHAAPAPAAAIEAPTIEAQPSSRAMREQRQAKDAESASFVADTATENDDA